MCKFQINNLFEKWVNKFEVDEAPDRKAKKIKVLFRGVSKGNPYKDIVIVQAAEGVISKNIQEIFDNFKKNAEDMSNDFSSTWLKSNVSHFIPYIFR